jgi:hypothetical protein
MKIPRKLPAASKRCTFPSVPFVPQLATQTFPEASHSWSMPFTTAVAVNSPSETPVTPSNRTTFSVPPHWLTQRCPSGPNPVLVGLDSV